MIVQVIFSLDSVKQLNVVTYYKSLEFLGDIGGFQQVVLVVVSYFGCYFSAQFFKSSVVTSLFKLKG